MFYEFHNCIGQGKAYFLSEEILVSEWLKKYYLDLVVILRYPNVWIKITISVYIDRLVGLVVSMSDYWSWGRGFDPRHFHKF